MTGRSYNISNPVISKGSGKTLIVIGAAVKDDSDNIIGDMISAVNISRIQEKINEFKFGENGYSILISDDGTIITHPDESLIMKSKITELDDSDMVNLGKEMLKSDSGDFKFGAEEVANGVETTKSVSENFTEIEKTFKEIESVVLEVFNASNIMEEKAYTTSNSIKEVAGVTEENSSATEEVTAANCRNNK